MGKKFIAIFFILLANISLLANSMTFHYHDTIEDCVSHEDELHEHESSSSPVFFLDHEHDEKEHDPSQHCHEFENQNTFFLQHSHSNFKKIIKLNIISIFYVILSSSISESQELNFNNYKVPILIKPLFVIESNSLRGPPSI